MLKKVVITNYLGESMEYLIDGVQEANPSGLIITSIDGLGPVKAEISMTKIVTTDGEKYNSSRLSGRNIVIKGIFTHASSIEEARHLSYKYFPIGRKVRIEVYTDEREGETYGYVESNEPDIFEVPSGCQISILCESPFFTAIGAGSEPGGIYSKTTPLFKLPFKNTKPTTPEIKFGQVTTEHSWTVEYDGDSEPGIELAIEASGDVRDITIIKDSLDSISIDTDRMAGKVPNTMPTNLPLNQCSFIADSVGSSLLTASEYSFPGFAYMRDGVIDVFMTNATTTTYLYEFTKHYRWNGHKWIKMSDISYPAANPFGQALAYVVHRGFIYRIGYFAMGDVYTGTLSKLNESTNKWEMVDDNCPLPYLASSSMYGVYTSRNMIVDYHDEIYFFLSIDRTGVSSNYNYFYKWNEDNGWTDLGTPSMSEYYSFFDTGAVVVYNDEIHFLGIKYELGASRYGHLKLNSNDEWIVIDEQLPGEIEKCSAVVYNNRIYMLSNFARETSVYNSYMYTWSEDEGWLKKYALAQQSNNTFIDLPLGPHNIMVTDSENIYIVGNGNTNNETYTAPPNNVKLIKGDRLVLSTIKGEKGLKLYRDGNEYNVINALSKNPPWFTLHRGDNTFDYLAGEGIDNLKFSVYMKKLFEGM